MDKTTQSAGSGAQAAGIEIEQSKPDDFFVFPTSITQRRFWVLDQLERGNPAYNIAVRFRLLGPLVVGTLERAFNEMIRRHEVLRTTFIAQDGQPVQLIAPLMTVQLPVIDLRNLPQPKRNEEAERLTVVDAEKRFNLAVAPLLRVSLLRMEEEDHILLITIHHIISDGWSIGVITTELGAIYEAFAKGEESPLPELPIQYADFTTWQKDWLEANPLNKELSYWKRQLHDLPELDVPSDHPRTAVQTHNGEIVSILLPKSLTDSLRDLSNQQGVTLFMTSLAAFQILLHRYTGQNDIVVGSPIAGRNRVEIEPLIGVFINTLVLRSDLSGDPTFAELLGRVSETVLQAVAHQDIPFEQLVDALRPKRDASRNPLFQVNFTYQRDFIKPLHFSGITLTAIPSRSPGAIFDLNFFMVERAEGWRASCEYNTNLFDKTTPLRMLGHLRSLMESIAANPRQRLSDLKMLSPIELGQLLMDWSLTVTNYPRTRCIHEVFEEQAARTPDAEALVFEGRKLTYQQLNQRANHLAHQLREHDVGPETLVAICAERSLEMVVGLLAILKAGGAYVPLDPAYPSERLAFMLQDTQAPVLLTQQHLAANLPPHQATVIYLDTHQTQSSSTLLASESPRSGATADNLAYVMYTSGSTGKPKGTTIPHRGVVRLVKETNYANFGREEVFLQFAPISFDASTLEIWGPLLNGGRLVIMPPGTPSMETLGRVVREQKVTTLWLTAGLFRVMVDNRVADLKPLRQLLAGGDVLPAAQVRKALQELPGCRLINGYGPTENTTFTCCHTISEADLKGNSIPIGRPIANTQVYILDRHLHPVPVGAPGELFVGGDGLARGYLNRPELTAEKFVRSPFSSDPDVRLYRTGDLCRYLPDGRIEFLGRIDQQVKIRGFRIELEEIEAVLGQHPAVREVLVMAREDVPGEKFLAAYLAARTPAKPTAEELRGYLKTRLPDYMVPTSFVVMDSLPLTLNGKVDKRILPVPDQARSSRTGDYVPPSTPIEEVLAGIWAELLHMEKVGMHDNFFELGGNSLLSIQIIDRINKAGLNFTPGQFFQHQTIAELAKVVNTSQAVQSQETNWSSLVTLQPNGSKPPFFLIHTSPGDVLGYMKLVYYLGNDQPCYGFQSLGLHQKEAAHTTLEAMAAHYVKLLREFQPEGPYYLGGWCFGGNVAWEMAQQLAAAGQTVALLALLETWAQSPPITYYRYYIHRLGCLLELGPMAVARHFKRKYLSAFKAAPVANPEDNDFAFGATQHGPLKNREYVYGINLAATRKYKCRPYPGIVTLFNGTYYESLDIIPPQSGFMTLASGVEIHLVPGGHRSVIKEPSVRILADKLKACLTQAQADSNKRVAFAKARPVGPNQKSR
ncbi:MAG: Glutamate-semialdehyde aminotransferase [Pedosphaera sp.]|nr:Glutamate-semialdehyde aminotransferase [Pedosphaera sp.]